MEGGEGTTPADVLPAAACRSIKDSKRLLAHTCTVQPTGSYGRHTQFSHAFKTWARVCSTLLAQQLQNSLDQANSFTLQDLPNGLRNLLGVGRNNARGIDHAVQDELRRNSTRKTNR